MDDGHTVYSMEAFSGRDPDKEDLPELTGKERRALIRAAFSHYLPPILIALASFTVAALLIYVWLLS